MEIKKFWEADSDTEYLLIHGYTGGPMDFNGLPEYIHDKYNANVKIPLLVGHGLDITALDDVGFDDFLNQMRGILDEDIRKYERVVLVGVSWGAVLALYLASEYPVAGVLNINLPTRLRFPFNLPGVGILGHFRKYWPKVLADDEIEIRKNDVYYPQMHANGFKLINEAKKALEPRLGLITAPVLSVHSTHDKIGSYRVLKKLEKKIRSKHKKVLFTDKRHNILYIKDHDGFFRMFLDYFEKPGREYENQTKVAAVIPAYNEAAHIAGVLGVITKVPELDEIIVVDDASTDATADIVKNFKTVKYIKNPLNGGKALSMQRGVDETDADIIFFCDADLRDLKPEMVSDIISPVLEGKYDMFIGLRNNLMQKAFKVFALNSGERAIRRELWDRIPVYFKYRYRIEAGMNFVVKHFGKGYAAKRYDYYQTVKEDKYGVVRGELFRWWMYFDVLTAYLFVIHDLARDYLKREFSFLNKNKQVWQHHKR